MAARGGLTAAQAHEVWAACTRLRNRNVDDVEMLHGTSIVLKVRNTGKKSDWSIFPPGVSVHRSNKFSIRFTVTLQVRGPLRNIGQSHNIAKYRRDDIVKGYGQGRDRAGRCELGARWTRHLWTLRKGCCEKRRARTRSGTHSDGRRRVPALRGPCCESLSLVRLLSAVLPSAVSLPRPPPDSS